MSASTARCMYFSVFYFCVFIAVNFSVVRIDIKYFLDYQRRVTAVGLLDGTVSVFVVSTEIMPGSCPSHARFLSTLKRTVYCRAHQDMVSAARQRCDVTAALYSQH